MPRTPITTSYTPRTKPSTSYTVPASVLTPEYSTPRKEARGLLTDYWFNQLTDYNWNNLTSIDNTQVNKIITNYT